MGLPSERGYDARIAVVVLHYRTPGLVLQCLETLVPEVDPERDRVIVVDNASGDESAARIHEGLRARHLAGVRLLVSPVNGGFAAGNNLGVRAVRARAYLLLNSDTLLRPGAVERLWAALQDHPEAGLVSPRLEWPSGEPQISCFRFLTPWSELIAAAGTAPVRSLLARWDVPIPVRDVGFAPDWTSFAAVLIRDEALARVGPLDEGFFMYFEDVDYCWRAARAGWRTWHEPRACVVHLRGGTSPVKAQKARGERRPSYYYASRRRYFRNTRGRLGPAAANLMWTLGRLVSWTRETFGRKARHTVERELLDIWAAR